ncbi:MAG: DUF2141 domain-containing protein [Chitinophagaceae bacterium]
MLTDIRFTLLLCLTVLLTAGKPVGEEGIKLSITNLRNNNGHVLVSLFKDGAGYPDDVAKAFRTAKLEILDKKATVLFSGLPSGSYAISILHDENNDQRMNKSFLGLPKEGYGFSNNVIGAFGPPGYNRASFRHASNTLTQVSIRVKY